MKVKYFEDADTALLEFSDKEVAETVEINENVYVDLDDKGGLVRMTIEHAKAETNLLEVAVERYGRKAAGR